MLLLNNIFIKISENLQSIKEILILIKDVLLMILY